MLTLDFLNRHAVVTGGTGALGTAVVQMLVDAGAVCHIPALAQPDPARFPLARHERVRVTAGIDLTDEKAVAGFYSTDNLCAVQTARRPLALCGDLGSVEDSPGLLRWHNCVCDRDPRSGQDRTLSNIDLLSGLNAPRSPDGRHPACAPYLSRNWILRKGAPGIDRRCWQCR